MISPVSISLFDSSKNECENLCRNRGERFPSIFDLTTQATDSDTTDVIWTDGVFDYNNEIWTDSSGKAIPDKLWENSTWLRKESCIMGHNLWYKLNHINHIIRSISYGPYGVLMTTNSPIFLSKSISNSTIHSYTHHFICYYRRNRFVVIRILLYACKRKRLFRFDPRRFWDGSS